jgi:predicted  nucleic acid-binding Zn-ribbon protein
MQTGTQEPTSSDRYDFDRLERSVEFLIEEHERLSGEREALLEELIEREQRISALTAQLEEEATRRRTAVEGVDKILSRLAQLQTSVSSAVESA